MSKGLEAFNALGSAFLIKCKDYRNNAYMVLNTNTGEMYSPQELTDIVQKELKALEIIKEKEVSLMRLRLTKNYKHYNLIYFDRKKLSEEEYNLLKGVL